MHMFKYRFMVAASMALVASMPLPGVAVNSPDSLSGFNQTSASSAFTERLRKDDALFSFFSQNPKALELVLQRPELQDGLVKGVLTTSDIQKRLRDANSKEAVRSSNEITQLGNKSQAQHAESKATQALARVSDTASTQKLAHDDLSLVTATAADTKADDTTANILASAAKPAPASTKPVAEPDTKPVTAASGPVTLPPVPIDPPEPSAIPPFHAPLVDINAAPADVSLDERGWPKYLNVPADCPAADRSKHYIHHWRALRVFGTSVPASKVPDGSAIRLMATGSGGVISLASDEVYAVPFFVPHGASGQGSELGINFNDTQPGEITNFNAGDGTDNAVHRCPGQLEGGVKNRTVAPIEPGSVKVYGRYNPEDYLQPGRWYFFNIHDKRGVCESIVRGIEAYVASGQPLFGEITETRVDANGQNIEVTRQVPLTQPASRNSRGKAECGALITNMMAHALPQVIAPFTFSGGSTSGPNGKTYYAPNYDSGEEGAPLSGLSGQMSNGRRVVTRCYDPTKRLPMAEFIKEAAPSGLYREVKALGPAWNTYACETEEIGIGLNCPVRHSQTGYGSGNQRATRSTAEAPCRDNSLPVKPESWVCAQHREGQTRKLVITYASGSVLAVEECKWNEERQAYAWHATYDPNYLINGTPNWGNSVKWLPGGTPFTN